MIRTPNALLDPEEGRARAVERGARPGQVGQRGRGAHGQALRAQRRAWAHLLLPRDALDRALGDLAALDRPLEADEEGRLEGQLPRPVLQEATTQPLAVPRVHLLLRRAGHGLLYESLTGPEPRV